MRGGPHYFVQAPHAVDTFVGVSDRAKKVIGQTC